MKRDFAALLFLSTLLSACTTGAVTQSREAPTGLGTGEAIAFLFERQFSLEAQRVEESEIIGCISEAVHKAHPTLRIVLPDEFRRTAFPDLAPEAAPNTPEYIALLLNHPTFKERVASLGVRYLISIVGPRRRRPVGSGICRMDRRPGGAVLVIAGVWDRKSSLTASVLDLQRGRTAGKVEASASRTSVVVNRVPQPTHDRRARIYRVKSLQRSRGSDRKIRNQRGDAWG